MKQYETFDISKDESDGYSQNDVNDVKEKVFNEKFLPNELKKIDDYLLG